MPAEIPDVPDEIPRPPGAGGRAAAATPSAKSPRAAGRLGRRRRATAGGPPEVTLGTLAAGGLAPAIMPIVERGVRRRPALATVLRAEIELQLEESDMPVRIVFGERQVLVEDGRALAADVRVEGALADLVSLMVVPLMGGLPSPARARGRAALGMVAVGRVRFRGRFGIARRFLAIIRI